MMTEYRISIELLLCKFEVSNERTVYLKINTVSLFTHLHVIHLLDIYSVYVILLYEKAYGFGMKVNSEIIFLFWG